MRAERSLVGGGAEGCLPRGAEQIRADGLF